MAGNVKERGAATAPSKAFSLISDAKLKELYSTMFKCRAIREQAAGLSKQNEARDKDSRFGLPEATVAGTTIDLRLGDWVAPCEGDLTAAFVKGISLNSILDAVSGDAPAGALLHATRNVLRPTLSASAKMNIAIGIGLANRASKAGNVALVFSHAKATSGKHWREAASFASKNALPILFVVYEKDADDSKGGKKHKKQRKRDPQDDSYGFPVIPVDANDVVAMYRVAHESIQKARQGRGPTLIEARAFRSGKRHRKRDADGGKSDDAIVKMEEYLTGKGLFMAAWKQKFAEQFQRDLDVAIEAAK